MAKITITTDEGEVVDILSDAAEDIGFLTGPLVRAHLWDVIARAVEQARAKDKRGTANGVPAGVNRRKR